MRVQYYNYYMFLFFFQAEDGIRDLVRSRGLGDVYKRQELTLLLMTVLSQAFLTLVSGNFVSFTFFSARHSSCLLYTSDAADERSSVDLGGRRIIKKKNIVDVGGCTNIIINKYTDATIHNSYCIPYIYREYVDHYN